MSQPLSNTHIFIDPSIFSPPANKSTSHYHFIHSSILSSITNQSPTHYIFILPPSTHPSANHSFTQYTLIHPSIFSFISLPLTHSLHLHPYCYPLIHHRATDPVINIFIHPSILKSPHHSAIIHCVFIQASILLSIRQLFIHSLHLIHPSFLSSISKQLTH